MLPEKERAAYVALREDSKYVATPVWLQWLVLLSWFSRWEIYQTCQPIYMLIYNECVPPAFEKIDWCAPTFNLSPPSNSGDAPNKERQEESFLIRFKVLVMILTWRTCTGRQRCVELERCYFPTMQWLQKILYEKNVLQITISQHFI